MLVFHKRGKPEHPEKNVDAGIWTRATVLQKVDGAIHRINHYPLDSAIFIRFHNTYPLDSDLSGG